MGVYFHNIPFMKNTLFILTAASLIACKSNTSAVAPTVDSTAVKTARRDVKLSPPCWETCSTSWSCGP